MRTLLHWTVPVVAAGWLAIAAATAAADDVLLLVDQAPARGPLVAEIDLTGVAARGGLAPRDPAARFLARDGAGRELPVQFIPAADGDPAGRMAGTVIIATPGPGRHTLRLSATKGAPAAAAFDGQVVTPHHEVVHAAAAQGGFPTRITLPGSGTRWDGLRWNDRLFTRELGGFNLSNDRQARVSCLARGPLATVVRVAARFLGGKGQPPDSQPQAVYDWYYFHDRPLVLVKARFTQQSPAAWKETHFLELHPPEGAFPRWAGGNPPAHGPFAGTNESQRFTPWAALVDGRDGLGMFDAGAVAVYDGKAPGARYLHAHADRAWQPWESAELRYSGWMWIGSADDPAEAVRRQAAEPLPDTARVRVSTAELVQQIAAARAHAGAGKQASPRRALEARAAEALTARGRFDAALAAARGTLPDGWTAVVAGELGLVVERTDAGIALADLGDTTAEASLLAPQPSPLFEISLRHAESRQIVALSSHAGWRETAVATGPDGAVTLRWRRPADERFASLEADVRAVPDAARHAVAWQIDVRRPPAPWSVWRVVFPQVTLAPASDQTRLFLPQAAGNVKPWRQQDRRFRGIYPTGWTTMQYLALYEPDGRSGLYVGMHDPWAGTKEIVAQQRGTQALTLALDHAVPDMGRPGNRFELSGSAVWRLFRGDWFDAAMVYRDWVRREARWYPRLSAEGRDDTPRWMRELCVWAMRGGAPQECVAPVAKFAEALGLPAGFHWYTWHQIPFDNDYPHYFPTKPGFREGVAELQRSNVFVMPYINGRLWDTRDQGTDDHQFTSLARVAATKDDQGQPYVESYSSKERDGSPVKLAAMCPTTKLWQDKQSEIVRRLMHEEGVKAVYLDQVAAAKANLCFDAAHGHPLGGGHWWGAAGYWPLLERLRREKPADGVLTTECNAEPYIRWFDGYLTWHWQYEGQVPAFPAVYGGTIQLFGRAYRGGETRELAMRMKAGQQLVFGEQLGWLDPGMAMKAQSFPYFRDAVRLRWQLRDYFYAGEMARQPRLDGPLPRVDADWQWQKVWPVSTDAVLAGAWAIPAQRRLVLLLTNVSDAAVATRVHYDARPYGLAGDALVLRRITADGPAGEPAATPAVIDRDVRLEPRSLWAWEVSAGPARR